MVNLVLLSAASNESAKRLLKIVGKGGEPIYKHYTGAKPELYFSGNGLLLSLCKGALHSKKGVLDLELMGVLETHVANASNGITTGVHFKLHGKSCAPRRLAPRTHSPTPPPSLVPGARIHAPLPAHAGTYPRGRCAGCGTTQTLILPCH